MSDTLTLYIKRVIDGDTVEAQAQNGDTVSVRVWGIDAPEMTQPYGKEAMVAARELVGGDVATIDVRDEDQYGRLVGRVQAGGIDLGSSLAKSGYAWHARRYPTSGRIKEAERDARQDRRGLWAQENPVPPWQRRGESSGSAVRGAFTFFAYFLAFFALFVLLGVLFG